MLVAAHKTTEREGHMVYSIPYTTDPVSIRRAGKAFPSTVGTCSSTRRIAMVGDSYGQAFDDFRRRASDDLRRVTTSAEAFALVSEAARPTTLLLLYAGDDYLKKTGGRRNSKACRGSSTRRTSTSRSPRSLPT